jgi:iron complex outermembrane receptor protein
MPFGEDENTMTFPLRWPAALVLALPPCVAAAAQDTAPEATLPEITVTVNKQAENLDAVPASVSVFDGAALEAAGVRGLDALSAQVPGFSFQAFGQSGVQPPVMRGLTANFVSFSSSTLLLVDGVPTLMAQGFEHNLQGVDRELIDACRERIFSRK